MEIYPEEPAADIRGTFRLVNRTNAAIDSVHVWLDPKIFYGTGAVVMYLLRDYIGEERVKTALRRYLEKYRDRPLYLYRHRIRSGTQTTGTLPRPGGSRQ